MENVFEFANAVIWVIGLLTSTTGAIIIWIYMVMWLQELWVDFRKTRRIILDAYKAGREDERKSRLV